MGLSRSKANAARCRRPCPHSCTRLLAEIRLCGALLVGRQCRSRLCEVGARGLDERLDGRNDAGGVLALQRLGLESLDDKSEDLGGLGEDGGILSIEALASNRRGWVVEDVLLDELCEESICVRCCLFIVCDGQRIDPRGSDFLPVLYLCGVVVQDLGDGC